MFIGHFAVALAAKRAAPKSNLATMFAACQLLDLLWPVLVLAGLENVRVDHDATAVTPLDFVHYPYSHSLVMSLLWSVLAAISYFIFRKDRRASLVIGLVVLSHWVLDVITHRADMPLSFDGPKIGFGLWNSLAATLMIESALFIFGIFIYLRAVEFTTVRTKWSFWTLIGVLGLIYVGNLFGPKPPVDAQPQLIAGPALAMWLFVLWAYFVDRTTAARAPLH